MKIQSILRNVLLLLFYSIACSLSLYLAYQIRFDFELYQHEDWLNQLYDVIWWSVLLKLIFLYGFGQFNVFLSYFRMPDMYRIAAALGCHSAFMLYLWYVYNGDGIPPRSAVLTDFNLSLFFLCAFRMGLRIYRERYLSDDFNPKSTERVMIIGAGDAGASLASDLLAKRGFGMRPVVFVDDEPSKIGREIHGLPVADKPENLMNVRRRFGVDKAIIAMPSGSRKRIQELVKAARDIDLPVEIIPSLSDLASGKVQATQLRPVEFEDLLGRDPVKLDSESIKNMVRGKVVMVTGAGGSIGGELCRQIASLSPRRVLLVEQSEVSLFIIEQKLALEGIGSIAVPLVADITDEARMRWIFSNYEPELIFHAAAHKHVPMMEQQPGEAIKNNSLGTLMMGRLANEYHVGRFVLISTDKAINPTSAMGASKRLAERFLQTLQNEQTNGTQYIAVRFGNVLGSSGSVVPIFKKQIADGGPVTVTHPEVTRYFMTVEEAVGLVLQAATIGNGGDVLILDMGEPVKIADMARQLIELCELRPDIDIEVKYVGLRPGEKLNEELSYTSEHSEPTSHSSVSRILSEWSSVSDWEAESKALLETANSASREKIKEHLKKLVPEYTPHKE